MWWTCYRSEVEQRGRNIHLRELLHPEEDSITSRDELFNNFDGGDVLENRMFWLSGDIFLNLSQTMCINNVFFSGQGNFFAILYKYYVYIQDLIFYRNPPFDEHYNDSIHLDFFLFKSNCCRFWWYFD